jgi:hypothetical protein
VQRRLSSRRLSTELRFRLLFTVEPKKASAREIVATLLYGRALSHVQASIILLERGAVSSAKAILRVMLEAAFNLGACVKDATFVDYLVTDDRRRQAELYEALVAIPGAENGIPPAELARMRTDAVEIRKSLKDHPRRDLNSHIVENAAGELDSLKWGPESSAVDDLIDAAIQIFFAAAHATLEIFPRTEIKTEFERLWAVHGSRIAAKTEPSPVKM